MLKMKNRCESCKTKLDLTSSAFICSYECTYCADCATRMRHICPNCSGNLVERPKRTKNPLLAAVGQTNRRIKRAMGVDTDSGTSN